MRKSALIVVVGGILVVTVVWGAPAAVRHRAEANDERLASELQLLLAAPVPDGYEVLDPRIRGGGACLRPFGCASASASVRFSVPEGADPCRGVDLLVEAWPVLVERTYGDCNVVGSVDGTHLTIGVNQSDPLAGGAAVLITT